MNCKRNYWTELMTLKQAVNGQRQLDAVMYTCIVYHA